MSDNQRLLHNLIVNLIKDKFSKEYSEVSINPDGYPDITLSNFGMAIMQIVVETEAGINEQNALKWKSLAESPTKLTLVLPKSSRLIATELLWQHGLSQKVKLAFYDIKLEI